MEIIRSPKMLQKFTSNINVEGTHIRALVTQVEDSLGN